MPTWKDVVAIGSRFPGVEVGMFNTSPALRVEGKGICRMRSDPDALVVRVVSLNEREALLQNRPQVYFSTPHYAGHPYILVRLEAIDHDELAELIEDGWRTVAHKRLVRAYEAELTP